ncbi:MAG TPA: hypothetical protein VHV74_12965 [Pseudonocardiaceae bacterium]|nr:hypothetical protein [Pseudonocardiaceae bacterium]
MSDSVFPSGRAEQPHGLETLVRTGWLSWSSCYAIICCSASHRRTGVLDPALAPSGVAAAGRRRRPAITRCAGRTAVRTALVGAPAPDLPTDHG